MSSITPSGFNDFSPYRIPYPSIQRQLLSSCRSTLMRCDSTDVPTTLTPKSPFSIAPRRILYAFRVMFVMSITDSSKITEVPCRGEISTTLPKNHPEHRQTLRRRMDYCREEYHTTFMYSSVASPSSCSSSGSSTSVSSSSSMFVLISSNNLSTMPFSLNVLRNMALSK
jgi:hypothetical protein